MNDFDWTMDIRPQAEFDKIVYVQVPQGFDMKKVEEKMYDLFGEEYIQELRSGPIPNQYINLIDNSILEEELLNGDIQFYIQKRYDGKITTGWNTTSINPDYFVNNHQHFNGWLTINEFLNMTNNG